MGKDKGAKAVAPVKEKKSSKTDAVKSGRVTKATEKPKAVAEKTAKKTAKEVEKKKSSKKSKKEPTPEPSSSEESSESEDEASSDSESSESEAEKPAAKKEASSDSSDSDSSESEDEKPAPKSKKEDKKAAKKEESSDSSSSESEAEAKDTEMKDAASSDSDSSDSDSEEAAKKDSSDSSDSDSSSDDEEEEKKEEVPSKKRKAEETAEPSQKKIKVVVNGEEKEATANLFVGNLSWNIDEEWLTREFEEFGELQGVRIITDRDSGRSKGFGYVEFTNAENGAKALEGRNGYELDGRGLRVDFSAPRDANAQTPQQKQNDRAAKFGDVKNPPAQTLFVGNISFEADESTLTEYFQEHGSINSIRLPTDRETGAPKGFGYVEMGSIEEAQAAFEALQGADVAGRPIRLDYAAPRDNSAPRGGGFGGDRGGRGGRGGGRGGFGGRGGGRGRGGSDRGGRGGGRGGSFNRGGFGDFSGKKVSFD